MVRSRFLRIWALLIAASLCFTGCMVAAPAQTQPSATTSETLPPEPVPTTVPQTEPVTVPTEPMEETIAPTAAYVESTASVGVTGDMLLHKPLINSAATADGYDFSEMFSYVREYYQSYDCMIANLETTLGGREAGPYQGYPHFNCPDAIVDGLLDAGVDMLLTANNHSFDTGYNGMMRTVQVLQQKGMAYLGTRATEEDDFYVVRQINGIRIGMVCYTYETDCPYEGQKALNCIYLGKTASKMVNSFHYGKLDRFCANVASTLLKMKEQGADFTMVFLHWGDEYSLKPNTQQQRMAQMLCELGVDVIVGGHPHVVQPFDVLTSALGHKTYCIYSVGNALSNQRAETLSTRNAQYTEDGMIFGVEFEKWSDGTARIRDIHIIPTWVSKRYSGGKNVYRIIPLDASLPTWSGFQVSDPSDLQESYERTMAVVGEKLDMCRLQFGLEEQPKSIDTGG